MLTIEDVKTAHFIGIGGAGMSPLAEIFMQLGVRVQGSDRERSYNTDRLQELGAKIFIGHDANNITDEEADTVVVSSAISQDNEELIAAEDRDLRILHRSQAINLISKDKQIIAVAGSHGKTTTVSMLATAMYRLGEDITFINGGIVKFFSSACRLGTSKYMIIEADESDGSFTTYSPYITILTNIDGDHLSHYGDQTNLDRAFYEFLSASKIKVMSLFDTKTFGIFNDLFLKKGAIRSNLVDIVTFGPGKEFVEMGPDLESIDLQHLSTEYDEVIHKYQYPDKEYVPQEERNPEDPRFNYIRKMMIEDFNVPPIPFYADLELVSCTESEYTVRDSKGKLHTGRLGVPGVHNAVNACGALTVLEYLGFPIDKSINALGAFCGTKRRFDFVANAGGVCIFEDYAHHPTEIEQTLKTARKQLPKGNKLIAVFQPHLVSRTLELQKEFAQVLEEFADFSIILDVDAAREKPKKGVNGSLIFGHFEDKKKGQYCKTWEQAITLLKKKAKEGDYIFTMGCGSVNQIVPEIISAFGGSDDPADLL